jgi:hypothetical protein
LHLQHYSTELGQNADPLLSAALASQSLSIMIALIPYVRECFRRHLSPTQAVILVEFDKLKRVSLEFRLNLYRTYIHVTAFRIIKNTRTRSTRSLLLSWGTDSAHISRLFRLVLIAHCHLLLISTTERRLDSFEVWGWRKRLYGASRERDGYTSQGAIKIPVSCRC